MATALVACQDKVTEIFSSENVATAIKDGTNWTAFVRAGFDSAFGDSLLSISMESSIGLGLTQDMVFQKVPAEPGSYNLVPSFTSPPIDGIEASLFEIEGGDVISQSFSLDTSKINSFSVDSYDPVLRKIKISFEAHFITKHQDPTTNIQTDFIDGKITTVVD